MTSPVLVTKLFIPPTRPEVISRTRLVEGLNEGLLRKLTLVSAPAGFGKTTLVSEWVNQCGRPTAWLSLDDGDNDPIRFFTYVIAALRTVAPDLGEGALTALQSPQPPAMESILTALLNELTHLSQAIILVLDDYHVIDSQPVSQALTFLLGHLPPQVHLVLASREDPNLPLSRLRAQRQLSEFRATDLRFTAAEAAEFLNTVMGLTLSATDIAALDDRTEGWIAGLQLAAISMQGQEDVTHFIQAFTGSHRFVMDYLVEEVLNQQPSDVQTFLLGTSILDRLSGPLCDAVMCDPQVSGQAILAYLERANLFLVPLDNERRWYRYHHLFRDLLRQRLTQGPPATVGDAGETVARLHRRASAWYEDNGWPIDAFQHAAAANDFAHAERLIEGDGMPLQLRGAGALIRSWLESLPKAQLDARPSLWVTYAATLLYTGQHGAVEAPLISAETALQGAAPDDEARELIGRIALLRATLATVRREVPTIIAQSRRALAYLRPDNLSGRTTANWLLGCAHQFQGDRAGARQAYNEVLEAGRSLGGGLFTIAAISNLGQVEESDNQLSLASRFYRRVLDLVDGPSAGIGCQAHLGLARIAYERNDLATAHQHGQHYVRLKQQIESLESFGAYAVFLSRLKLAQGDAPAAVTILAEAEASAHQHDLVFQMPEIAAAQVLTLLRQGQLMAAAQVARTHTLPLSQARVSLAQNDPVTALALLEPLRQQAEATSWHNDRLRVMILQALAHHMNGATEAAVQVLGEALTLAEPEGFIRIFVDEGASMAQLLSAGVARGDLPVYASNVLAAFAAEGQALQAVALPPPPPTALTGTDALSQRELEVLRLIAQGLSNQAISERLFLALSTVKGHNLKIFEKLQVKRRTEAVVRAQALGLV